MRASLNQRFKNAFKDRLGTKQHFVIPKANHAKAAACQTSSAFEIFEQMVGVLPAVDLYDQPRPQADEVHNVTTDRHLPSESIAAHPAIAQVIPEATLGFGRLSAKDACVF